MPFHRLKPDRPCTIWRYSTIDAARSFQKMVFAYELWSGEPVFNDPPHYFVRRGVAEALRRLQLTGFEAIDVTTIKATNYDEEQAAGREPEPVCWLKVHGQPAVDDFGLQVKVRLIVSQPVLEVFKQHGMRLGQVEDYDPDYQPPSAADFLKRQEVT